MQTKTLKEIAQHFLMLCAKGTSHEAFGLYASKKFKHHNAFFKGDAKTLMDAMEENAKQMPDLQFVTKHVLQDGNMVAVHSLFKQNQSDLGTVVMHILKFENDKIIELWDFGQAVPKEIINENGMF